MEIAKNITSASNYCENYSLNLSLFDVQIRNTFTVTPLAVAYFYFNCLVNSHGWKMRHVSRVSLLLCPFFYRFINLFFISVCSSSAKTSIKRRARHNKIIWMYTTLNEKIIVLHLVYIMPYSCHSVRYSGLWSLADT